MKVNEEFHQIRQILNLIPDAHLKTGRGKKFNFPIYMTESLANTEITALELNPRSYNCLRRVGINTIGDLCENISCSSDLRRIRNCGTTSVEDIMDHLFAYQFSVLSQERKVKFLVRVVEMNLEP